MSIPATSAPPPAGPSRGRWRRFFVGSALVTAGVIIGIGTSALSQGYGGRGGWFDDGPSRSERSERFDGPRGAAPDRDGMPEGRRFGDDGRGSRRFALDEDGRDGWFGRGRDGDDGPPWRRRWFGGDGPGGWHGGWFGRGDGDGRPGWFGHRFGGGGGMFLTPGRIERMVNRLAWAVDASSEQKQKLRDIAQRAADDLRPLREKRQESRKQLREVLTAPTIDRAKLEALRADGIKAADEASRRIVSAVADAAEVLTPEQRAQLAQRLERFRQRGG